MANAITPEVSCPQCGSEMYSDYDAINKVRVEVCTKPTCLYRVYPDYPRRSGNQEICYICGKPFTVSQDNAGVLCPRCKSSVQKNKTRNKTRGTGKTTVRHQRAAA